MAVLNFREAGSGDPVVLIHGFPFNNTLWDAQLAAVPEGWRFIAPDLRGFGASELGDAALSMDSMADDVIALMDDQKIDQAVMCGMSMGGYVQLSIAARYAARIRAHVFVATRAGADSETAKENRHALATRARVQGPQPVVDSMLPKLISAHTRMKHPEIVDAVRVMMESTRPETLARALEAMAARPDRTEILNKIDVSTIVIRGELDEIVPAPDMEQIARSIRGARHEMIALAGHMPPMEASDVFNKILFTFLAQLPPAIKLDFNFSF